MGTYRCTHEMFLEVQDTFIRSLSIVNVEALDLTTAAVYSKQLFDEALGGDFGKVIEVAELDVEEEATEDI